MDFYKRTALLDLTTIQAMSASDFGAETAKSGSGEPHHSVAHCHLGLGKLYRRTGKCEQAQEHLATATTMYREMDMRFWLEQAEAELRE